MYKILLLISLIAILPATYAQPIDSTRTRGLYMEGTSKYYLQKSKSQKTTGLIMIGGGAILEVIGIGQIVNNLFSESHEGEAVFIIGSGLILGSIPVFIASGKNRRKAIVSASGQPVSLGKRERQVPSLTLSLPIGR